MAGSVPTIKTRITLDGAEDVQAKLRDIGSVGQRALEQIRTAGSSLADGGHAATQQLARVGAQTLQSRKEVEKFRDALHVLKEPLAVAGLGVGALRGLSITAGLGVTALSVSGIAAAAVAFFRLADASATARKNVTGMFSDTTKGNSVFEKLIKSSKTTGTSIEDTSERFGSFFDLLERRRKPGAAGIALSAQQSLFDIVRAGTTSNTQGQSVMLSLLQKISNVQPEISPVQERQFALNRADIAEREAQFAVNRATLTREGAPLLTRGADLGAEGAQLQLQQLKAFGFEHPDIAHEPDARNPENSAPTQGQIYRLQLKQAQLAFDRAQFGKKTAEEQKEESDSGGSLQAVLEQLAEAIANLGVERQRTAQGGVGGGLDAKTFSGLPVGVKESLAHNFGFKDQSEMEQSLQKGPIGVDEFVQKLNAVSPQARQAAQGVSTFGDSLEKLYNQLKLSIGNSKAGEVADSGGKAAADFLSSFVQHFRELLSAQFFFKSPGAAPDNKAPGHAGGGFIQGPGTGTSDSILSWLSNGEYVVRADGSNLSDAISHFAKGFSIGGLVDFDAPRFAEGGLAHLAAPASSGGHFGTVDFRTDAGVVRGIIASDTMKELSRAAVDARVRSGGQKPSHF